MFAPDVEARFKKIEDNLVVAAELLRRFETKTDDRLSYVEAVQEAMAKAQEDILKWMAESERRMNALTDAHISLARTVELFLKARSDGGAA